MSAGHAAILEAQRVLAGSPAELGLHVLLDESRGGFAVWALRSAGLAPARGSYALLALDGRGFHESVTSDAARALERAALETGLHVARPGAGTAAHVYAERVAAPGRLVVGAAAGLGRLGALAVLALPVNRLEAAAALASRRWAPELPLERRTVVALAGAPAWGVSGHDVALALEGALPAARTAVIEFTGSGVASLAMRDRFTLALAARALGAQAVLFPSDETTHAWLKREGRDADWKRAAPAETAPDLELALDSVEPWLARPAPDATRRRVRHATGTPVRRVVVGPGATYDDWLVLAARWRGKTLARDLRAVVVPGSRRALDRARATGVWQSLLEAGATFAHDVGEPPARRGARAVTLGFGVEDAEAACDWRASLETVAASALAGAITDPRDALAEIPESWLVTGASTAPAIAAPSPVAPATPPARPLEVGRGVVLLRGGDDLDAGRLLPWGPRAAALPPERLVELLGQGLDPRFAARAQEAPGGWVVAGRNFLAPAPSGEPGADLVAWLLARAGIRVVIAGELDRAARTQLVEAGILPLEASAEERARLAAGDQLELPGGLAALEPDRVVTVRDLTHGDQFLLRHRLDAFAIALLERGGLLAPERP